jgi:putative two-component system response regulator
MYKTKKVFMVDDDEIHLLLVEEILKNRYEVITAKSGKDALEHLRKGVVPDLILLDILMPQMDGWKTFIKLRAINSLHDVPIVFLTSVIEAAEVKHALEMGAADYITKPYETDDFLSRIEKLLTP